MTLRLSVVIPTRNGWPYLQGCLSSLRDQTLTDIEVLVVDDASSDGSADSARDLFPFAKLIILSTQKGFASACNVGIQAASGGILALPAVWRFINQVRIEWQKRKETSNG